MKRCPFCAAIPDLEYFMEEFSIRCREAICPTNPETMYFKTKEKAIASWNVRDK
jgi:hypothetical protein